jgi:ABC-type spermidine/putrescine transport system permease subunit I
MAGTTITPAASHGSTAQAASVKRERWHIVAGLAPVLLWQTLFFVIPMLILLVYSFWTMRDYRLDYTFTLDNYVAIFTNPIYFKAFLLSLQVALFVTVICAVLAVPVAYFIAKKAGRWRVMLLVMVIIPFWVSLVMRAFAWRLLLGERGFINRGLELTGVIEQPFSFLLYSPTAIVIGLIYAYLPLYVLPLYASFDKVRDNWIAAAQDLNATPMRAFWEVTFPLAFPGLMVGAVFCFIFGLGEYIVPALLGGGKSLMISQAIRLEFELRQNWPGGAALSIVLMAIVMAILAVSLRWLRPEAAR